MKGPAAAALIAFTASLPAASDAARAQAPARPAPAQVRSIGPVLAQAGDIRPTLAQARSIPPVLAQAGDIGPAGAAAAARAATGGRVLGVQTLNAGGRIAYRVKLLLPGGRVRTVTVDGASGRVG